MIDWERVRELREDVGDSEFRPILELFLDEIETIVFRLVGNRAAQMPDDFHFLTGCARNLGFRGFGDLCEELEGLAQQNRLTRQRIEAALDVYSASKQAFVSGLEQFALAGTATRAAGRKTRRVRSGTQPGSGHA